MLDDKIFELEQQYGIHIPDKRKKIWDIELELLDIFDGLCRKYNLRYFFFWGSLLGAVRHHGFIPWDDDIDVVMPREDYDKLAKEAVKDVKSPYFLLTKDNVDESYYICIKLIKENTTFIDKNFITQKPCLAHHGICIDIVPLDGFPVKRMVRLKQYLKQKVYYLLANKLIMGHRTPTSFKEHITQLFVPVSKWYCGKKGRSYCNDQFDKQRSIVSWEDSELIVDSGHHHVFQKNIFNEVAYLDFEGRKVPVPANYDLVLKQLYGDYWKLPEPKYRLITDHEAMGYIVEPDISYIDYLDILQRQRLASAKERDAIFHRYCDKYV